ncbi:MAG: hypothetical protein ACI8ZB_003614 [Desulforhopalus sp.]
MNHKKLFLLLLIFILVGGAIILLPSDEKKIKDNLVSLAEYCSTDEKESVLETLQKVTQAAKLCADPLKVHIDSVKLDNEFSSKDVTDHILMLKKRLPNTSFSFQDTAIDIPSKKRAIVITTLSLEGVAVDGRFTDAYEVNITVDKEDGDWRFSSFTVVEFMKK